MSTKYNLFFDIYLKKNMSIKSNSRVENDETTEKGMFQQMIENVDMYGTKHALQNQKGEKV